jgi:hypothetical protein
MKAKPPALDASRTGTHRFGCRQGAIADETRCHGASTGRPSLFWTQESGECRFSVLLVPSGYVSGAPLSSTSTYTGQTYSSLGVIPGSYGWTWGTGENQNFTLIIGTPIAIPEPSSTALLGMSLAGLLAGTIHRLRTLPLTETTQRPLNRSCDLIGVDPSVY